MKRKLFFISLILFFFSVFSQEVKQTFRPVFLVGIVASQVDGDTYAGYRKLGYFAGLGVNRQLSKKVEIEFDITFLQKGARKNYATDSASLNNPNNEFYLLRLNYVEIPLFLRFSFKKFKIEAGGAWAYLIKNPPFEANQNGYYNGNNFKNFDYSILVGVGFKLKENSFINLRYEYSVVPFRDYYASSTGIYHGQFPYSLFNTGLYNNLLILSFNYKLPSIEAAPPDGQ